MKQNNKKRFLPTVVWENTLNVYMHKKKEICSPTTHVRGLSQQNIVD